MGGMSIEFSSIPVVRRCYPDTEQRIATHSLRLEAEPSVTRLSLEDRNHPRAGLFFIECFRTLANWQRRYRGKRMSGTLAPMTMNADEALIKAVYCQVQC